MKTVFLFPGQGAQYPGMGKDFYDADPRVRTLFEEASDIGGRDWTKILFESTDKELQATDVTQVAIVLVSMAASMAINSYGITASACAGFSLGEFPALCEAGVIRQSDLLRIVDKRGNLLERISRSKDSPDGPVGMTAVLGLLIEQIAELIDGIEDVYIALHSGLNQTVLSGTSEGLTAAETRLDKAGAMRLIRLKVSGPFHSPLLKDARCEFAEFLDSIIFSAPRIPIFVNTTATSPVSGDELKKTCVDQLDHCVRWVDCQNALMGTNPQQVLEAGPGRVLTGLWKSMKFKTRAKPAGTLEEVRNLI